MNDGPMLLTARELSARLGVSLRTIWRWAADGSLPEAVDLPGDLRWLTSEIEAWLAARCPRRSEWQARRPGRVINGKEVRRGRARAKASRGRRTKASKSPAGPSVRA